MALQLVADSFLALASMQTPGALVDRVVRQRIGGPTTLVFKIWVLAIGLELICRRLPVTGAERGRIGCFLGKHRVASAAAGALVLACALTLVEVPSVANSRKVIADLGLALELPSRETVDCSPTRGCHLYKTNEFGFRGPVPRRDAPGTRIIAVVGDSHIYGIGVDEDQTIPARLEEHLRELGYDVRVANVGIPGLSMVSFPSVIEYANRVYAPDLVVALIKEDDVDAVDHNTRLMSLDRRLSARVLYVLNWEIVYEAARQVLRTLLPATISSASFAGWLDDMQHRCAGHGLLLLTDLNGELGGNLRDWLEEHAAVGWYSSWDSPDWHSAPRIPGDGHWNASGSEAIAKTILPAVTRMLDGESVRPRQSNGTR